MSQNQSFVRRLRFGLGVLVGTSVLGLSAILVAEHRVRDALERSQESLSLLEDFKEVQVHLSTARTAEQEFLLEDLRTPSFFQTGASATLEKHRAALDALEHQLQSLESQPEAKPLGVVAIRKAVSEYAESFGELVELYHERGSLYTGKLGAMREAVHGFDDALSKLEERDRLRLRTELLELVRHQADYLRYLSTHEQYLADERLEILREEIAANDPPNAEELLSHLARYERAWKELAAIDEEIGRSAGVGLRGRLRSAQETVIPLTTSAVKTARAHFQEAAKAVESSAALARQISAGACALAVAVGLFLAVSLSRQLRQSLAALLGAVEAYARGDRSARVGTLPRRDEFARLGEAFDHMAETLAETADELEEMNASLELAVKGDTEGLIERIKELVAQRKPPRL